MDKLDYLEGRIEEAKTLQEMNRIIAEIQEIVFEGVSIEDAKRIDDLMAVVRKKILTVRAK